MNQLTLFDYGQFDTDTRRYVEVRTSEIKALVKRSAQDIIEIGGKLIDVKARLGHGNFGAWLESEFGWSNPTAQRFMNVAEKFVNLTNLDIAPSALYLLAAPSTPDEAVDEAVTQAANGTPVTYTEAKEIIGRHKELESFICGDCGEIFSRTVWHCPYCDHHWLPSQLDCPNCHNDRANEKQVSMLRELREDAPELFEAVKAGDMTIPEAKKIVTRAERVERVNEIAAANSPLDTSTRYPVIYADPPWEYEHTKTDNRRIDNHYPTMALEDICAMPVSELATPDAVLFLWATSPKLEEALQVVNAWGFTYRTCMVWVKPQIGMGYYARQQHELLLIATRGSLPVPEPANRPNSVLESPRTEHSRKPEEYYGIIEGMYPEYGRIELFSRNKRPGWATWGNQS